MFKEEDFEIFDNKTTIKQIMKPIEDTPHDDFKIYSKHSLSTRHEIVVPKEIEYKEFEILDNFSAKKYEFPLDEFQKISLTALERDESVLVAAHTSSGKTVVAEYAIALSLHKKQRVIYTSPIKALSNQKYRELQNEFSDVGLMTGDITLNPQATCLVMTTEILRNILYRGSEILREIHWVIFDEIHYMRDKSRGVIWEETIVLLPDHVKTVFLSATIPNALEFTSWVSKIHKQVVHVVYTEKRITPLTHYIVNNGGRNLFKIKYFDEKRRSDYFDKSTFASAIKNMEPRKRIGDRDMKNILSTLLEENCLPVIVFSFSRRDCERFALSTENDFLKEKEKESIQLIFKNALASLREEDRELPLINNLLPLLLRGIGIHHSGLLPILKEIVEILFQEGLLKVLFATETFSIGLNMPAKCVIFTSIKKFDGTTRRIISPGEYIQMSGRAGRRGIDDKGIVIIMLSDQLSINEGMELLSGTPDKLNSAFYLSYNMLLNLTRVEGLDPLYLLNRSFFHFQKINERSESFENLNNLYKQLPNKPKEGEYIYKLYLKRNELKENRKNELKDKFKELLIIGGIIDLFILKEGLFYFIDKAIITNFNSDKIECSYFVDGGIITKTFPIDTIDEIYKGKVKVEPRAFFKNYEIKKIKSTFDSKISEIENEIKNYKNYVSFDKCLLCLNLSKSCIKSCKFIEAFNRRMHCNTSFFDEFFAPHKEIIVEHFRVEKINQLYLQKYKEYQRLTEIYHMSEYQKMLILLKKLNFCDDRSILPKGKIACEISSGNELILTEMIFNDEFSKMSLESAISLLSCFVFEEWQTEEVELSEESKEAYEILKKTALKIIKNLEECGLEVDEEVYLKKFSYEIMDVVRLWICGHTFGEICSKTSIFEGSIIRCLRMLEELLRQLSSAARVIGNIELENIFGIGITKIKRDIVFAGSLYL